MTMECKVGRYFKRTTIVDMMFGNADHHLRELARMGGLISSDARADHVRKLRDNYRQAMRA
jgi:hypothetical protein